MQDVLLGATGIVVTVATFVIGFRQTIGARQERIRSIDEIISSTLLKRIVLEGAEPSWSEVEQFINGKAQEARLAPTSLRSPDCIADLLFATIQESDLISTSDRQRASFVLRRLGASSPTHNGKTSAAENHTRRRRLRLSLIYIIGLGVAASIIGTTAVAILSSDRGSEDTGGLALQFAIGLTLAIVAGLLLVFRRLNNVGLLRISRYRDDSRLQEISSYPDELSGRAALDKLEAISSPFAVRDLVSLGFDEMQSLRAGVPLGLADGDGLGSPELLKKGYIKKVMPPRYAKDYGYWYVLTDEGRLLARLMVPCKEGDEVPDYLRARANGHQPNTMTDV